MDTSMVRERRQHPRVMVACPVIIETSRGIMTGETKDISSGGAFIHCRQPLKIKEVFDMAISVSLLSSPLKATAEVIRSNASGTDDKLGPIGMGVRFTNISDEDRQYIYDLVSTRLKAKSTEIVAEKRRK